jgi:Tol biopolymer transport system component
MGMKKPVLLLSSMVLAVLLTGGVSFVGAGESAHAASPGPSAKIVFTSDREGNPEIYLMNSDGSNQTRLTYTPESEAQPTISPDGTRIAFQRGLEANTNDEIYVMNSDGSNQTRLTFSPGEDQDPTFSPDGTKIAFVSARTGDNEIYVMNSDGSNQTELTFSPGEDQDPTYSPDGTKIIFAGETLVSHPFGVIYEYAIYVMNSDGSDLHRLNDIYGALRPDFSPDGTKIAFEHFTIHLGKEGVPGPLPQEEHGEIYVMNSDGSNPTRLTNNTVVDSDPTFSPDGTKIAFFSDRDGPRVPEIYAMNTDGSSQTNLTNNAAFDFSPDWGVVAGGPGQLPPGPTSKAPCKNGGYKDFGFKNQGQCIVDVKKS